MKKLSCIFIFLVVVLSANSQTTKPTQSVINDFAKCALIDYQHGNGNFTMFVIATMSKLGYSKTDITVKMENLQNDQKTLNEILNALYQYNSDKDMLFTQLHSLGMSVTNAKSLMEYVIAQNGGTATKISLNEIAREGNTNVEKVSVSDKETTSMKKVWDAWKNLQAVERNYVLEGKCETAEADGFEYIPNKIDMQYADLNSDGLVDCLISFTPMSCDNGKPVIGYQVKLLLICNGLSYKIVENYFSSIETQFGFNTDEKIQIRKASKNRLFVTIDGKNASIDYNTKEISFQN